MSPSRTNPGKAIDELKPEDFTRASKTASRRRSKSSNTRTSALDPEPPEPPPSPRATRTRCPKPPRPPSRPPTPGKIQYHDKRLIVIFFDFSNMGIPEQLRAQEASLKFLDKQMTTSDMVAILLFTTAIQVKTDFTADRDVLDHHHQALPIGEFERDGRCRAIPATTTKKTPARPSSPMRPSSTSSIPTANSPPSRTAVRKLAALPGEEGAGLHHRRHQQDRHGEPGATGSLHQRGRESQRGHLPDRRPRPDGRPSGRRRQQGRVARRRHLQRQPLNAQRASINGSQETLATLAADTGGKVFLDSNDLTLGFQQVQQEFTQLLHPGLLHHQPQRGRQVPQDRSEAE